jgi:hypothetical protein
VLIIYSKKYYFLATQQRTFATQQGFLATQQGFKIRKTCFNALFIGAVGLDLIFLPILY